LCSEVKTALLGRSAPSRTMSDLFFKIIEQLNSSVFVLLGLLAVSFWSVFRIGKLLEQFSQHKTKIEKVDTLSDQIIELKVKVDLIYQNTNPNKTVAAQSPISITPSGREIATKIGADRILQRYLHRLSEFVDAANPKTAYDVQTAAMTLAKERMMALLNADEINAIKAEAYARGLLVEDIMAIFGVLLRDSILKKKGWSVSEVDKQQVG
jgi:hypothetical protein